MMVPEWKGSPSPFTAKISILPKSVIISGKIPLNTIPKIIKVNTLAQRKLFQVNV